MIIYHTGTEVNALVKNEDVYDFMLLCKYETAGGEQFHTEQKEKHKIIDVPLT